MPVHIVMAPISVVTLPFPEGYQAICGHPVAKFKKPPKYERKKWLRYIIFSNIIYLSFIYSC